MLCFRGILLTISLVVVRLIDKADESFEGSRFKAFGGEGQALGGGAADSGAGGAGGGAVAPKVRSLADVGGSEVS